MSTTTTENSDQIVHSLSAPLDQIKGLPTAFDTAMNLSRDELSAATNELLDKVYVNKFPRTEKFYADKPLVNQTYGLISFTPSRGSTPDKEGVYGMVKIRGTFSNEMEANNHAEHLIRSDSYHPIYYTYVGKPFPLTKNGKYISETKEIDIRKKITEEISKDIRARRDDEDNTIKELKEKEEELLKDCEEDQEFDPIKRYTELAVKRAHLKFTYVEQSKKMIEIKQFIENAEKELKEMDVNYPECKKEYFQVYMDARKKVNLPDDDQSFLKYLGDDLIIE